MADPQFRQYVSVYEINKIKHGHLEIFQNHPQGNMKRKSHELTYTAKVN